MKRILSLAVALVAVAASSYAQLDPSKIKSISISKTNSNAAITATREIGRSSLECVYKAEYPEKATAKCDRKRIA